MLPIMPTIAKCPWGFAYKILNGAKKGSKRRTPLSTTQKEDGTWTSNEGETLEEMLWKYFPDGRHEDLTENNTGEARNEQREKEITANEVRSTARSFDPKKVSGIDGIPTGALKHISEVGGDHLTDIFRACWRYGVFPWVWKTARVVWPSKPGGGFRPICLLEVVGKILDKIVAARLQHHLETGSKLAGRQFGFRYGRSTTDALETIIEDTKANKAGGRHSLLVTLDISNAFNSISHETVRRELREAECPQQLQRIAMDFINNREVRCGGATRSTRRGCPQGSCSGPVLWLIAMEGWFRDMDNIEGIRAQAYADDQMILIQAPSARYAEEKWREVETACRNWANNAGLKYNGEKTEAMWIGARSIIRKPSIKMGDQVVEIRQNIKYLGMTLDSGMLWTEHLRTVRGKLSAMANRLFLVAGKRWGTSTEMLKSIYRGAVEPMILYGAEIWGERAKDVRIKRHANAAQRPYLRAITRSYRTAATAALQVIAGIEPLSIKAQERFTLRRELKGDYEAKTTAQELIHPAIRGEIGFQDWQENEEDQRKIYTDGSVMDGRSGYAIVTKETRGGWEEPIKRRTSDTATIMQAELHAIRDAVREASRRPGKTAIISDSRAALGAITATTHKNAMAKKVYEEILEQSEQGREISLWWTRGHTDNEGNNKADAAAKEATERENIDVEIPKSRALAKRKGRTATRREWQRSWDEGNTGRLLHGMMNSVSTEVGGVSRQSVQLLTGHGNMSGYLRRFRLSDTNGRCECGSGEEETAEHIWLRCSMEERQRARAKLIEQATRYGAGWPMKITDETDKRIWEAVNKFAAEAIIEEP